MELTTQSNLSLLSSATNGDLTPSSEAYIEAHAVETLTDVSEGSAASRSLDDPATFPKSLIHAGKTFRRHPLSGLFPVTVGEDYDNLKRSVAELGLLDKIQILADSDNEVLDGWNRLRVCIEIGVEPAFEKVSTSAPIFQLAFARNIARRNLSTREKGIIAGRIALMPRGHRTDLDGKKPRHESPMKDNPEIENGNQSDPGSSLPTTQTSARSQPPVSLQAAAKLMGVSRRTAILGKRVASSGSPSLLAAITKGIVSLAQASAVADLPDSEQVEFVNQRIDKALAAKDVENREAVRSHALVRKLARGIREFGIIPLEATKTDLTAAADLIAVDLLKLTRATILLVQGDRDQLDEGQQEAIRNEIECLASLLD
jgi:hypothetical protein